MAACLRRSVSDESVNSHDNLPTEGPTTTQESTHFLPRFVRDDVTLLSAEFAKEGEETYQFNVKWTGKSRKAMECFEKLNSWQQQKSSEASSVELVECDGGCGRMVPQDEVVQFGDCDHLICTACLHKAPGSIALIDGSPGCCNQKCLSDRRLKSPSATSFSRMSLKTRGLGFQSSACQVHVVHLTLVHYYLDNGNVARRLINFEMWSNYTLEQLKHTISKYIPIHEKSSIFFTTREKFRRYDLNPLLSMDDRSLEQLTNGEERLIVAVTDPCVSVFK